VSNKSDGVDNGLPADEELVRQALEDPQRASSREAASTLFARYRRRVYAWCYRYVRDHDKAMDLAQDVLLNAYRTLGTFAGRSCFSSWLYAIAKNRCLNELRRPALFKEEEDDPDSAAAPGSDPEELLIRKLDEDNVIRMIEERLAPAEQEVLYLRCFERLPIDMITEVLEIKQASGARGVLQQARRKLRAALEARQVGGSAEG
jgi:RNA polymerase sigma-70 factor, ECF subfamily